MSDGDNPFVRPAGWSLMAATNPTFYPTGNNLVIGRSQNDTNLFDIVWTEETGSICYLEALQYFPTQTPGGPPPYLYSPTSTGYDPDGTQHAYAVWVVMSPGGTQLSASVTLASTLGAGAEANGKLGDAGSLAGLWGADAKPTAPTTVPEGTAKP